MRLALIIGLLWAMAGSAVAQVTTDGTVGPAVALPGPDYAVTSDLGRLEGGNLFHSFSQFDVGTGESATFSGPESVRNVIARVTGNNVSDIDGKLASTISGADVFFINPAGVIFGPNASLDIDGSFHVSTADEVRFPDGGLYSALDPAGSILTTAPPEAFGFLTSNPASILIDRSDLSLSDGRSLFLIGGDITIQGEGGDIAEIPFDDARNSIILPGGNLALASVASPGEVLINPTVHAAGFEAYGDITIKDSNIDLSGEPAGGVYIRGGDIVVQNTWMLGVSDGTLDGSDFTFHGDAITIQADRPREGGFFETPTLVITEADGTGRGGNIAFEGGTIVLLNGVAVEADSFGLGPGGNVTISGDSLTLRASAYIDLIAIGSGPGGDLIVNMTGDIFASEDLTQYTGLFTDAVGTGDAGDIRVNAERVLLFDNGSIESYTYQAFDQIPTGNAGDIFITADEVLVDDASRTLAEYDFRYDIGSGSDFSNGTAGSVEIEADRIVVRGVGATIFIESWEGRQRGSLRIKARSVEVLDGGEIISQTTAGGPGSDIRIEADEIHIKNQSSEVFSNISAFSGTVEPAGNAGNLIITADILDVGTGGILETSSFGSGDAGSVVVNAEKVVFAGDGTVFSLDEFASGGPDGLVPGEITGIFSNVREPIGGSAGSITVNAKTVESGAGAIFATTTEGRGGGGTITINADSLMLTNNARLDASTSGVGAGGDIVINVSGNVVVQGDSGGLYVRSFSTEPDAGLAGSISVSANELKLEKGAQISTDSAVADGGNITIDAVQLVYASDAFITTSVGDGTGAGGNILIDPVFVVLDSSVIQANAFGGPGGNITIVAGNFLASPDSVIQASSAVGIDGTVSIDAPDVDLSGTVTVLPEALLSASEQLATQCNARGGKTLATFVGRGRSGLPAQPGDAIVALYRSAGKATPSDQSQIVLPGRLQIACE